jgi:hypothetical protein
MVATWLNIPKETTPQQLVQILEKVLPGILIREIRLPPDRAKALAPWLAREIVMKADACGRTHMITDASAVYLTTGLTKEECDNFRVDLEKLIVIRYKDRSEIGPRNSGARLLVGKLWWRIQELAGRDFSRDGDEGGGAGGGGIRG